MFGRLAASVARAVAIATATTATLAAALVAGPTVAVAQDAPPPAAHAPLPRLLEIEWTRGTNLPQGFQDSDGGLIGTSLVTVGGFCSGGLAEDNRRKPGRYPRGFLRKAWQLDLAAAGDGWTPLPDFPGEARQGLSAALVDGALYFWGGFSYTAPFAYRDGWRLSRRQEDWVWDRLPDFPCPVASVALTVVDTRVFACGGADYDGQAFYTETDRRGQSARLGARLRVYDTADPAGGWRDLPPCPGTPRWVNALAAVDGRLYLIGGASGDTHRDGVAYGYCTVVDNWRYDPAAQTWTRLADLPVSSGNFPRSTSAVYRGRYIVLPGGHQYAHVLQPDGSLRPKYGQASSANPQSGLHNDLFVYDTESGLFGTGDRLPIDNNLPMLVVHADEILLLGGETGGGAVHGEYYGHHPDLFLRGRIVKVHGTPAR